MENGMIPLENKEIRGVTLKQILWLFGFLGGIFFTVIVSYASITNKLENYQKAINNINTSKETQDLQIKTIQVQLQTIEIRLVRLETQINEDQKPTFQNFNK